MKLRKGISLTISAVDEAGQPTKTPFGILISGSDLSEVWRRPEPHLATCSGINSGNRQVMLIQQAHDGRHFFSDVLTQQFNHAKEPEVTIEDIELRPGVPIRGKLDDTVTRPVRNGLVIASQAPLPAGDAWDEKLPSVIYYDWAGVKEDGSFEFPAMPDSGLIQLIGLCDGWVGTQENSMIVGQQFDMETGLQEITLKMEKTFSVSLKIVDKNGKPIAGASCGCSPNQKWFKSGSTILGSRHRSADIVLQQLNPDTARTNSDHSFTRFHAVSDQAGLATIRNLPRNRISQRIMIAGPVAISNGLNVVPLEQQIPLPDDGQDQVEVEVVLGSGN